MRSFGGLREPITYSNSLLGTGFGSTGNTGFGATNTTGGGLFGSGGGASTGFGNSGGMSTILFCLGIFRWTRSRILLFQIHHVKNSRLPRVPLILSHPHLRGLLLSQKWILAGIQAHFLRFFKSFEQQLTS